MEIDFKGGNCVVIKSKSGLIITDPTDGINPSEIKKDNAITLLTNDNIKVKDANFIVSMPGEYEYNNVTITGIPAEMRNDSVGNNSTIYVINIDNIKIAIIGHIKTPISDDDYENLGIIDVIVIPVSGNDNTLDIRDATSVIREISPKVVIPTYYADENLSQEKFKEKIDNLSKEVGGSFEKVPNLKVKSGSLPEVLTVFEITKS